MMKPVLISFAAALTTAGVAGAQEELPLNSAESGQPAWYETFTLENDAVSQPANGVNISERELSLIWAGEGRWSLNLDIVSRETTTLLPQEQMQAGATYRVTPRFSVGGELSVGTSEIDVPLSWTEQELNAGVRVETSFRF